jgi:deazaflavin-dependent oxidoreductase (nitroreductase family)
VNLPERLGVVHRAPNPVQRGVQKVASSAPGAWVFSHTLHHVDRWLLKVSKGRYSVPGVMTGLPALTLTTTGRKTGQPRSNPLLAVPHGDALVLLGTGWGQERTPAWVGNLLAHPEATIAMNGVEVAVRATKVEDPEVRRELFAEASSLYPGYDLYPSRAAHREIVVFLAHGVD